MTTELDFSTSRALVYDANIARAQDMRSTLRSAGFVDIRVTHKMADFVEVLSENRLDLVIAETANPETSAELLKLRKGQLGENPFCVVLLTTEDARERAIKQHMASGADDVLVRPFAPDILKERIQRLVYERKPFIVSGTYVGPSRREHEKSGRSLNFMAVPNTLRELGTRNDAGTQAALSWLKTAKQKLAADRVRMVLLRMAAGARLGEESSSDVRQRVKADLLTALEEVQIVMNKQKPAIGELVDLLAGAVNKLSATSSAKAWSLVGELSLAVLAAWRQDKTESDAGPDLSSVVGEVKRSLSRSG